MLRNNVSHFRVRFNDCFKDIHVHGNPIPVKLKSARQRINTVTFLFSFLMSQRPGVLEKRF